MRLPIWAQLDTAVTFLTALRPARTLEGLWTIPGAPKMRGVLYKHQRKAGQPPSAVTVFCDIERIGAEQEDRLSAIAKRWSTSSHLLNAPPRALRRFQLMKALKEAGINRSDVFRLDDPSAFERVQFPCFVRYENGHIDKGGEPQLLASQDDLRERVAAMKRNGETLYGKIAVEYEDVRDEQGRFVKYSYFRVGETLIAGHRFVDENWFVKAPSPTLLEQYPDIVESERRFVETAPFQHDIRRVFDIAGISYGRIDFGLRPDGGVHVFEVNTNPRHPLLKEAHKARKDIVFAVKQRLAAAFAALVAKPPAAAPSLSDAPAAI